jgi:hypothetical protein
MAADGVSRAAGFLIDGRGAEVDELAAQRDPVALGSAAAAAPSMDSSSISGGQQGIGSPGDRADALLTSLGPARDLNGRRAADRIDASRLGFVEQDLGGGRRRPQPMAQTTEAWDWGVELRDEERSELERLRETVAQLRRQLDQAHESLRMSRQRERDVSEALRQLDEARPWRRRQVRTALRDHKLL